MEKESKSKRLKHLFSTHPKVKRFYFTSDNQAFFEKHKAEVHGATLEDNEVTPVSRAMFEQAEKAGKPADKAQKDKGAGGSENNSDNQPNA